MAQIKKVAVSGSVGKVVLTASQKGRLYSYSLAGSGKVKMTIRHGLAQTSGEVVWEDVAVSAGTFSFPDGKPIDFHRGMHVTVIGTGGTAYLLLD